MTTDVSSRPRARRVSGTRRVVLVEQRVDVVAEACGVERSSATERGDGFGRIQDTVRAAVSGLTPERLNQRLNGDANSIAWLIWHLTRVQDDHVAEVAGRAQV